MSFDTVGPLETESFPTDLVTGDFNRDPRPDVALGILRDTCACGGVEVLLGGPGPTLDPRGLFPDTDFAPFFPAVGDFNRDGKQDLAVTGVRDVPPGSETGVLILRGRLDGNFTAERMYDMDIDARRAVVAVGDFNRDGFQDLAVTNPDRDLVSVLLGAGRHTFRSAVSYPAGDGPGGLAVADLNRDGRQDLAVADENADAVSILLGGPRGTFAPPVAYPVGDRPLSLVVGDFNENGRPDLAVTNNLAGSISVLLGRRDGSFRPARSVHVGEGAWDLVPGDFNGNGHQDLAITRHGFENASEGVAILRGTGDGDFRRPVGIAQETDDCCARIDSADFNRDGAPDLVVDYENEDGPYGPGEVLLIMNAS
jgi:hypothetical protein